jgi:uncharacterized protein (DUF302 family)
MEYCFSRKFPNTSFEEIVERIKKTLEIEGFGVISSVDLQKTFKEKLRLDFKKYTILGACNPHFAHQALMKEENIGVFLPCNAVVSEVEEGVIQVSIVNPIASMMAVENKNLASIADEITAKLKYVLSVM